MLVVSVDEHNKTCLHGSPISDQASQLKKVFVIKNALA
jgi:hypothetical protein